MALLWWARTCDGPLQYCNFACSDRKRVLCSSSVFMLDVALDRKIVDCRQQHENIWFAEEIIMPRS